VIDRGRKVAEGTPEKLKASVGNSTLRLRLADGADQNLATAVVRRLLGEEPVLSPESGRMNVALADADRAADVLIGLRQAGIAITLGERRRAHPRRSVPRADRSRHRRALR